MRWWKAGIDSLGEQFQVVGELICFNVWYHILSYRVQRVHTHTYIYEIRYFFVVPYQVKIFTKPNFGIRNGCRTMHLPKCKNC
jgi:hypothetical protein